MPDLLWGFSLDDLDMVARTAATRSRYAIAGEDRAHRYEMAWSAAALHLAEVDRAPTKYELIGAGLDAIVAESRLRAAASLAPAEGS
ncbi:hypothetical protein ACFHW2_12055 [Actinomadura sp. LOL_016]|uniref:hypothetical protein n=1 Tax=unclassified Actinomadura TaxID=2626254 RepID=UPI003A7FCB87